MASDRAKNMQDAAFLVRKVKEKVESSLAEMKGKSRHSYEKQLDELNELIASIESTKDGEKKARVLLKEANKVFDDEFYLDDFREERKKILVQLNEQRRSGTSAVIRVSAEVKDALLSIKRRKRLKSTNEAIEYLIGHQQGR